ncbi:unnamed protein product [Amoebophrya sp. A25]|nr:unnamed protein product [Amoebophrya sp. A25]|eukprot:GSA25T00019643001.1
MKKDGAGASPALSPTAKSALPPLPGESATYSSMSDLAMHMSSTPEIGGAGAAEGASTSVSPGGSDRASSSTDIGRKDKDMIKNKDAGPRSSNLTGQRSYVQAVGCSPVEEEVDTSSGGKPWESLELRDEEDEPLLQEGAIPIPSAPLKASFASGSASMSMNGGAATSSPSRPPLRPPLASSTSSSTSLGSPKRPLSGAPARAARLVGHASPTFGLESIASSSGIACSYDRASLLHQAVSYQETADQGPRDSPLGVPARSSVVTTNNLSSRKTSTPKVLPEARSAGVAVPAALTIKPGASKDPSNDRSSSAARERSQSSPGKKVSKGSGSPPRIAGPSLTPPANSSGLRGRAQALTPPSFVSEAASNMHKDHLLTQLQSQHGQDFLMPRSPPIVFMNDEGPDDEQDSKSSAILDAADLSSLLDDHHDDMEQREMPLRYRRNSSQSSSPKRGPRNRTTSGGGGSGSERERGAGARQYSQFSSTTPPMGGSNFDRDDFATYTSEASNRPSSRGHAATKTLPSDKMRTFLQDRNIEVVQRPRPSAGSIRRHPDVPPNIAGPQGIPAPPLGATMSASASLKVDALQAEHAKKVDELNEQLTKAERALHRRDARFSESRDTAVALRRQNARLEKELSTQKAMVEKLRGGHKDVGGDLDAAKQQIRKLENQIFQMAQTSSHLLKIEKLQKELELAQKHEKEAEHESERLGEENQKASKELSILSRALAVHADEVGVEARLLYDYGRAREEVESLKVELAKVKSDLGAVRDERDHMAAQMEKTRRSLSRELEERQKHQERAGKHEANSESLSELMQNVQAQKLELEKKFNAASQELTETKRELMEAKGTHGRLSALAVDHELKAKSAQLEAESRVQAHLDRVQEVTSHADAIQAQLNAERTTISEERQRRTAAEAKNIELEDEMKFLKRKYEAIDKIQIELDEEHRVKEERLAQLEEDVAALTGERDNLERHCAGLRDELEHQKRSRVEMQAQFETQERNVRTLVDEKSQQSREIAELVRRLRESTQERFRCDEVLDKQTRQIEKLKRNRSYLEDRIAAQFFRKDTDYRGDIAHEVSYREASSSRSPAREKQKRSASFGATSFVGITSPDQVVNPVAVTTASGATFSSVAPKLFYKPSGGRLASPARSSPPARRSQSLGRSGSTVPSSGQKSPGSPSTRGIMGGKGAGVRHVASPASVRGSSRSPSVSIKSPMWVPLPPDATRGERPTFGMDTSAGSTSASRGRSASAEFTGRSLTPGRTNRVEVEGKRPTKSSLKREAMKAMMRQMELKKMGSLTTEDIKKENQRLRAMLSGGSKNSVIE